jgi:hypothetical protein
MKPGILQVLNFALHCSNFSLGMLGLKEAPLYFTTKKKMPRKAPWGELHGRSLGEEVAPL